MDLSAHIFVHLRFQCNKGWNSSLFGESHNNLLFSSLKNFIFCLFPYSFIMRIWIFHINCFVRESATPSCYCLFSETISNDEKVKEIFRFYFIPQNNLRISFIFLDKIQDTCTQDTKRIKKITFVF